MIECGRTGSAAGVDHAVAFAKSALAISHLPDHPLPASDVNLLRTFAILKVPSEASMSFSIAETVTANDSDRHRLAVTIR
jgi:uncharacterized protein